MNGFEINYYHGPQRDPDDHYFDDDPIDIKNE